MTSPEQTDLIIFISISVHFVAVPLRRRLSIRLNYTVSETCGLTKLENSLKNKKVAYCVGSSPLPLGPMT